MKRNIGQTDRIIRFILGAAVLITGLGLGSWWGLLGLIPLITGMLQWCPFYVPFRISTYQGALARRHEV